MSRFPGKPGLMLCGQACHPASALIIALCFWGVAAVQLFPVWLADPRYAYGWAAPILGFYFFVNRWGSRPAANPPGHPVRSLAALWVFAMLMGLARFIGYPNRDWFWPNAVALASAVGASAVVVYRLGGTAWIRHFGFALLFPLVAVPWPSAVDHFVGLSMASISGKSAMEILNWSGQAAVLQGSVLHTLHGPLLVGAACSGLHGMHAAIMMGLAAGEAYHLRAARRIAVLGLGVLGALAVNVVRVVCLALLTAGGGTLVGDAWHDTAGLLAFGLQVTICFGVAGWMGSRGGRFRTDPAPPCREMGGWRIAEVPWLLAVFALLELAVRLWYRSPGDSNQASILIRREITEALPVYRLPRLVRQALACDELTARSWESDGTRWIFFGMRWDHRNPGALSGRAHSPEVCLAASQGMVRVRSCEGGVVDVGAHRLAMRCEEFESGDLRWHVFFGAWEEFGTAGIRPVEARPPSIPERLAAVWNRRQPGGLVTLEICASGPISDPQFRQIAKIHLRRILATADEAE